MKKRLSLLLPVAMLLTLVACGSQNNTAATTAPTEQTSETTEQTSESSTPETTESAETTAEIQPEIQNHVLVAYFSATGTTKAVAENLADAASADLYEIVPAVPYTSDDLNYNDSSSRASSEQNDSSARPEISGSVENFQQYDVVFVGYPIWWGEEPRILDTFLESYDWSGMTVIPFCTSASSSIGTSPANLEALTSGATFLTGQRFKGGVSVSDLQSWINDLGLNLD